MKAAIRIQEGRCESVCCNRANCKSPDIHSGIDIRILAEIGSRQSVFEASKHLGSWARLAPQNNESANKRNRPVLENPLRCLQERDTLFRWPPPRHFLYGSPFAAF